MTLPAEGEGASAPPPAQPQGTEEKRPAEEPADGEPKRARKRSRWAEDEVRVHVPGFTTVLSATMSPLQQQAYVHRLRVEEIGRKLKYGDIGIPLNPEERSPSPEPIYDSHGKRLNTREVRYRKKLEDERHRLVDWLQKNDPDYRPPADYRPEKKTIQSRIEIPQEEYPAINFIGLIIGPRGNTLKKLEADTGAKVMIRGKGSVKEGRGRRDGMTNPGEDEPLHALVTGPTQEAVNRAVAAIEKVIEVGKTCPEGQNELKRMQLRELAALNGTLRDDEGLRCMNCGSLEHRQWQCTEKKIFTNSAVCNLCNGVGHIARDCKFRSGGAPLPIEGAPAADAREMDEEYSSFMQELGGGSRGGGDDRRPSTGPPPSSAGSAPPPWANRGPPPPGFDTGSSGGSGAYGPPRSDPPWQKPAGAPPPWQSQSQAQPSGGSSYGAPPPWQAPPPSSSSSNPPWRPPPQSGGAPPPWSAPPPSSGNYPPQGGYGGSGYSSGSGAYGGSNYGSSSQGGYGAPAPAPAPWQPSGGAWSNPPPPSSYPPPPSGYSQPPPPSSGYGQPPPPSSGYSQPPPPPSGYSQPPPPPSGYSQPPPPPSGSSQPPPPPPSSYPPPPPSY